MNTISNLSPGELRYFLHQLRQARYAALEDAENFTAVCFVLEELGKWLLGSKQNGLGGYRQVLNSVIDPQRYPAFVGNLKRLIDVRNDKSHQGVYARNAVAKAVAVSAALEDCLMEYLYTVGDIMVEGVVYAEGFMPLAKVRELMLSHSFSYLPLNLPQGPVLLSDQEVASCWRDQAIPDADKYIGPISALITSDALSTVPCRTLPTTTPLSGLPVTREPQLVTDDHGNVVGIVSAFDWL